MIRLCSILNQADYSAEAWNICSQLYKGSQVSSNQDKAQGTRTCPAHFAVPLGALYTDSILSCVYLCSAHPAPTAWPVDYLPTLDPTLFPTYPSPQAL